MRGRRPPTGWKIVLQLGVLAALQSGQRLALVSLRTAGTKSP